MSKRIEIKIDRSTLPADGQEVEWQTQNDIDNNTWKQGTFSAGEDLFCVGFEDSCSSWNQSFDVHHWRPYE